MSIPAGAVVVALVAPVVGPRTLLVSVPGLPGLVWRRA
jgi:hypothetical protein